MPFSLLFAWRHRFSITYFHLFLASEEMATKYILPSVFGSLVIAYGCDNLIADRKIFGGTTPKTVSTNEWWQETDKKFQAWPRTAGPPVVMNPITRQNFVVNSGIDQ